MVFKYISVLFSSLLYGQMYFFHWNGNCTWYHKKCAFFFLLFGNVLLHTDMVLLVFLKNNLSGFTVQSNSFVYMFLMLNQALYWDKHGLTSYS